MCIFAISTKLHLTKKPTWLDLFRTKYKQTYEYHVTLKQPCFIEEKDLQKIKTKLGDFVKTFEIPEHRIAIIFDSLVTVPEADGRVTVMINAQKNPMIQKLQREIVNLFPEYRRYHYPESETWERYFQPHLTIIADLDRERYEEARKDIQSEIVCEGYVDAIVLESVNDEDKERASNEQMVFSL